VSDVANSKKARTHKGFKQSYVGTHVFDVPASKENKTDTLLKDIVGRLVAKKTDRRTFKRAIDFVKHNVEVRDFLKKDIYPPEAILIVSYQKIITEQVQHSPLEEKRKNTQNIGINYQFCLTKLDLSLETFEKAIENNKYIKNQCWINTLNDFYASSLLSQDKAPRYRITKQKVLDILKKTEQDLQQGLSINDIVPFFQHFKLQLRVYDEFYKCIYKYDPEVRNHNYHALYCLCKNEHVYTCNYNLKELQQITEQPPEQAPELAVSPYYRINEDSEFSQYKMFESVKTDFLQVISECDSSDVNLIHKGDDLTQVLGESIECGYQPRISFTAGIVTNLFCQFEAGGRMLNVKIKAQRPVRDSIDDTVLADSAETFNKQMEARFNLSLIHI
jgi:hypothetical protein